MIDPRITRNLEPTTEGLWRARSTHRTAYPEGAHDLLFDVEEDSFWFQHRNRCIITVMQRFSPHGAVLDIGGGNGFVTRGMLDAGYPAILLESGYHGICNARSRGIPDIIHGTFEDARIDANTVDNAGLFDVLEHIENDVAFLKGVYTTLKPGGRLYLTVPAHPYLWSWTDRRAGHFRRYTRRSLQNTFASSNFTVRYLSYFFCGLPIPIFFTRTLPTRLGRTPDRSHAHRQKTHRRPTGPFGQMINGFLASERRWLRRGRLPFGASIIAVAQK